MQNTTQQLGTVQLVEKKQFHQLVNDAVDNVLCTLDRDIMMWQQRSAAVLLSLPST